MLFTVFLEDENHARSAVCVREYIVQRGEKEQQQQNPQCSNVGKL